MSPRPGHGGGGPNPLGVGTVGGAATAPSARIADCSPAILKVAETAARSADMSQQRVASIWPMAQVASVQHE